MVYFEVNRVCRGVSISRTWYFWNNSLDSSSVWSIQMRLDLANRTGNDVSNDEAKDDMYWRRTPTTCDAGNRDGELIIYETKEKDTVCL